MNAQERFLVVAHEYYDDLIRDISPGQLINLSDIIRYTIWVIPMYEEDAAHLVFNSLGPLGRVVDDREPHDGNFQFFEAVVRVDSTNTSTAFFPD
jgi:hypothetical protein